MDKKSLCAKISIDLHTKITEEKDQSGLNLNDYMEQLITQYYQQKEGKPMTDQNTKTMAIQISAELMDQLKAHLKATGQSQKAFIIGLIEEAMKKGVDPQDPPAAQPQDTEAGA